MRTILFSFVVLCLSFSAFGQDEPAQTTEALNTFAAPDADPARAQTAALSVVFRERDFDPNDDIAPRAFQAAATIANLFPIDKSKHLGLRQCLAAVEPMFDTVSKEKSHLWLRFHLYIHADDHVWAEVSIGNDSMHDPLGWIAGDAIVYFGSKQIAFRRGAEIPDQTGLVILLGDPHLAPVEDVIRSSQKSFPPGVVFPFDHGYYDQLFQWGKLDPTRQDHHQWTHRTGSPRNMYWPWELDGVWQYWFVHPPPAGDGNWYWVHRLAQPMAAFAHEQYGSWTIDESGLPAWFPGRTYHLFEYTKGQLPEPFDARKLYSIDQPDRPAHGVLAEGVIQTTLDRGREPGFKIETFGRLALPQYHVVNKEVEEPNQSWVGKRISGMGYTGQAAIGGPNWGWDHEHHTNERLFAAAICTPSEIARSELVMLARSTMRGVDTVGNSTDSGGAWQTGWRHSSRTVGWDGRMFFRAWQATGDPVYRDIARTMLALWSDRLADGRTGLETSLGWPPIQRDAAFGFAQTRNGPATPGLWESGGNPIEACWQASVAAMFFWLIFEQDEDPAWREKAKAAALYICRGVAQTTLNTSGFAEDYGIRFRATDGSASYIGGDRSWLGTRHWCMDAMAMAWQESGHDPIYEPARAGWLNFYLPKADYPYFTAGHEYGHKWHRYCALVWGGWSAQ